jgi:hypothetical protein
VSGGLYLGGRFNSITGENAMVFGPLGFSYRFSKEEAEELVKKFPGSVAVEVTP